ncbi:MAG TPA: superoxide dismutase family protein [Aquaticitalea sp.]|nr:superoxide dismutase family protein [Aquaticitalea sp.]
MKRILLMLTMCTLLFGTSCKNDKKDTTTIDESTEMTDSQMVQEEVTEMKKVQVALESRSNSTAKGNVVFTEENGTVTMTAVVEGLKEGTHAIHIHEKADCSAADGTSAGGHWNPTNQPHGKWGSSDGYHKGDIGNMEADADGNATVTITTDEWCIGCGDSNKDVLGHAIIVHDGTDDFKTQPTGDAGGRISCGGIIQ